MNHRPKYINILHGSSLGLGVKFVQMKPLRYKMALPQGTFFYIGIYSTCIAVTVSLENLLMNHWLECIFN